MIGPKENFFIHADYVARETVPHFDDTPHTDAFQDKVYERAMWHYVQKKCRSVIDIGCGSGFKLMKHLGGAKAMGVEMEPTLSWLRQTYPHRHWADAPDGQQWDLVICSDVIEHVTDPYALLDTIASCQPKLIVISTPAVDLLGHGTEGGPPRNIHHCREWNREQFHALISSRFTVFKQEIVDGGTQIIFATP